MRAKCYIVRHQTLGFLTERIFLTPPSDAEVAAVLAPHATRHAGPAWESAWSKVEETVLVVPDRQPKAGWFEAAPAEQEAAPASGGSAAPGAIVDTPRINVRGVAKVTR
jgi:hypothetical protein